MLGKPADVPDQLRERVPGSDNWAQRRGSQFSRWKTRPGRHCFFEWTCGFGGRHDNARSPRLSESRPRIEGSWPFLAAIAAAFLIGAIILRMMGPFNGSHPVMTMLGGNRTIANATPRIQIPNPPQRS